MSEPQIDVAEKMRQSAARARASIGKKRAKGDKVNNWRSRITNGKDFLPGVDQRSDWCRRARDVAGLLISDRGGLQNVSEAEKLLARRAGILEAELVRMEVLFGTAGEADPQALVFYSTITNTQRRLLEALGLKRVARDITPDLKDYMVGTTAEAGG